jgi:hypothetical protein
MIKVEFEMKEIRLHLYDEDIKHGWLDIKINGLEIGL